LEFEYEDYKKHILDFRPEFVKLLVKYNPSDPTSDKLSQKEKMKIISDFAHEQNIKFLLEVLVIPTEDQLQSSGDKEDFDIKLRPSLTMEMIKDLQNFGIEPDVWKLEGFNTELEYEQIVAVIKRDSRQNVGLVVLGRGADDLKVEHWLKTGAKVKGVIGFAVGRTIFWDVIEKFYNQKIGKAEVIDTVAENFYKFYKVFTS
jgi:5-dehydro-2-deoxygluconokinase